MDMPLIDAVRRVVDEGAEPGGIVRDLMGRSLKKEVR